MQRSHLWSSGICLASIKQGVQKVSCRFATSLSKVSAKLGKEAFVLEDVFWRGELLTEKRFRMIAKKQEKTLTYFFTSCVL